MRRRTLRHLVIGVVLTACGNNLEPNEEGYVVHWSVTDEGASGIPLVTGDLIVAGTFDGYVKAFDRTSGNKRWETAVQGARQGNGPPLRVDNVVVVAHGHLVGLDLDTGEELWRFLGPDGRAAERNPTISGDTVYTASLGGWVSAVSARTGLSLWDVQVGEVQAWRPTVSDELVIVGTRGIPDVLPGPSQVVALRKTDGSEAWRFDLPDTEGVPWSAGATNGGVVFGDHLIVGTSNARIYSIRLADGIVEWEQTTVDDNDFADGLIEFKPRRLGETLVFVRGDGNVEGRSPRDGSLLWSVEQLAAPAAPPAIRGDLAYFFTGEILVLDESGTEMWSAGDVLGSPGPVFQWGTVLLDGTIYATGFTSPILESSSALWAITVPELR